MTGAFKLTVSEGDNRGRSYPLVKFPFVIGRAAGNDITFEDKRVSRHHAAISLDDGQYTIKDLNSHNGTVVNGKKVGTASLKAGDTILIGGNTIIFQPVKGTSHTQDDDTGPNTTIKSAKDILKDTIEAPGENSSIEILKRKTSMLGALYDLSKNILQEYEMKAILELTADIIIRNIRGERVYVFMKDSAGVLAPVICRDSYNLAGPSRSEMTENLMFSKTLIKRVMDEAVSLLLADARGDSRFKDSESIIIYGIRSAMCVPLLGTESVIGAIYTDILNADRRFSEDELNLLTTIGNLAAIVIEQANLREKIRKESEARQSLMRYHSPQVVEEIVRGKGTCEVNERTISVLFVDIEKFTSLSEQLGPMRTAELLNEYFDIVTEKVFNYGGSIDKFIGDAAMAIFGAPFQDPDYIENAVRAALDIQSEIKRLGKYRIRIGINAGPAVIGNIGSTKRIEYTAIGDTVNIASRLEKMAGAGDILVSGVVHEGIRGIFNSREIGKRKVKGKSMEVDVYEVLT